LARQTPARQTPATFTSLVAPTTMVIPRGVPRWWLAAVLTGAALAVVLVLGRRDQRDDEGLALPPRPGPVAAQPAPAPVVPTPAPAPAVPPPAPSPAAIRLNQPAPL